jgi:hypothetical protein
MIGTVMQMNENEDQYVYIMSNPSFSSDILKIGWTKEHPNIRANNLYTLEIPTPFTIEYVIITSDGSNLETQIYEHLKSYRVEPNRDFFKISKDELVTKLTNDLRLELKLITDIYTTKTCCKEINKIKSSYEKLKKETDKFFSNLKKNNIECLLYGIEDNNDEKYIKDTYYFITQDIKQYEEWLDNLIDNYEEIKNKIGIDNLRKDNILFKKMILDTHKNFRNLKNKYEWDF